MKARDEALQDIADHITQLTRGVNTTTGFDRHPGDGADGVHRRTPEHTTWRLTHPGLLHQLVAGLLPARTTRDEPTSSARPGYRPPSSTDASTALDHIARGWGTPTQWHPGVWATQQRMRVAAGHVRRPARRTLITALEEIRALAHSLPEPWPQDAAQATHTWVQRARQVLTLDAPIRRFRDVRCPYCAQLLQVHEDSEVRCPNPGCLDEQGRRYRWARDEVAFLLEQLAGQQDGAA